MGITKGKYKYKQIRIEIKGGYKRFNWDVYPSHFRSKANFQWIIFQIVKFLLEIIKESGVKMNDNRI